MTDKEKIRKEAVLVNDRMFEENKLDFSINSEVKDVDLDKEIDDWYQNEASKEFENVFYDDIEKCAKHFFELGLLVSNKSRKEK